MLNALTIDLEDWFQVSNLEHIISYEDWGGCQPRLVENTRRLLAILEGAGVKATFFVLGWNAIRFPDLVRQVREAGHEIGSHGFAHSCVFHMTAESFGEDLDQANEAITAACGERPICYRAPSFSITPKSLWAFEVIQSRGFRVDSSVFPIFHERYGFRSAPRLPYLVRLNDEAKLVEAPPSTVRLLERNYPFAGGAYFRILPQRVVEAFCRRLNRRGEPVIFYLHPWELDPDIPRFRLSPFRQYRSYVHLDQTAERLSRLLRGFEFGPLSRALEEYRPQGVWEPCRGTYLAATAGTEAPASSASSEGTAG
ncbi:MAG: XrtA system polysaccharide deacetylase [Armatimonadota bacterium]